MHAVILATVSAGQDGPAYGAKADVPSGPVLHNLPLDSTRSTYVSTPFPHSASTPYHTHPVPTFAHRSGALPPYAPPSPALCQGSALPPYASQPSDLERSHLCAPPNGIYKAAALQPVPSFPSAKRWSHNDAFADFGVPAPTRQPDHVGDTLQSPAPDASFGAPGLVGVAKGAPSHTGSLDSPVDTNGVQGVELTSSAHSLDSQLSDEWVPTVNRRRGQPAFVRKLSSGKSGRLPTSVRQDRRCVPAQTHWRMSIRAYLRSRLWPHVCT